MISRVTLTVEIKDEGTATILYTGQGEGEEPQTTQHSVTIENALDLGGALLLMTQGAMSQWHRENPGEQDDCAINAGGECG